MSDTAQGTGWWQASDGKWYSPELQPGQSPSATTSVPPNSPVEVSIGATEAPPMSTQSAFQPAAAPPPGYLVAPQNPKTNGMAVASLVFGILWFAGIGAVLAVIFGFVSRKKIEQSQGSQSGGGLAVAGIVLGIVGVVGAIGLWVSLFALGAAVNTGASYANGYSYGVTNYSSGTDEASVCNIFSAPSGDKTTSWISGCESGWSSSSSSQ